MIIIRVMGGLGNQMFQYAFYRALQERGKDAALDLSWFQEIQAHNGYELERVFLVHVQCAALQDCKRLGGVKYSLLHKVWERFFPKKTFYQQRGEDAIHYFSDVFQMDEMYFSGYWQSEKYFAGIAEQIRKEFSFREELDSVNQVYAEKMQDVDAVSLHIRRGDYVHNPVHDGICDLAYYQRAIEYMRDHVENPRFFVFSDDIPWSKEHLNLKNAVFVTGNAGVNSYRDMQLMGLCQHHIIANSSFSWWGAWLNQNPRKIVVGPSRWFNLPNSDVDDLFPKSWIRI